MLRVDLDEAIAQLQKLGAKRVLIQIPEGLKTRSEELLAKLKAVGIEGIAGMDPCFGACDIKPDEAQKLGCDALLHVGHNAFLAYTKFPVVYAPLSYDLGKDFNATMKKLIPYLHEKKIKEVGLTTTIQFKEYIPHIQEQLTKEGISVVVGKGRRVEDGQVLGCNYTSAQVPAQHILYFGDGLFHPLGIHFSTKKEVIMADPLSVKVSSLEKEKDKFLRQRLMLIERARDAQSFAILVSSKIGQHKISTALAIQKKLIAQGKKADIYYTDFVSQDKLLGISAQAYINTACPRISLDDFFNYKKPILNYYDIPFLLGEKSYEDYAIDDVY